MGWGGDARGCGCAPQLFDASDKQIAEQTASVRRRADSNVADLVKGLAANYDGNTKAVLTAVNGMASSLVTALGTVPTHPCTHTVPQSL